MSNQITQEHDDAWLIKIFTNPEIILATSKSEIPWSETTDFQVFSEFLINDIQEMIERLKNADDVYLYDVCRHTFNILDWMNLMVVDAGFPTFASALEHLFEKRFGDKHILQTIYDECFEKWISLKTGQQKIGENFYNILEDALYYRNRFGQWFEVDRRTAYDLKPTKKLIHDDTRIEQLNSDYTETWYDAIIRRWQNGRYQGTLPDHFMQFDDKETSPEAYADFTREHIQAVLHNPVSIVELERWNGSAIVDLEDIVKISARVLDIANKRRSENSSTIYLLRDCLMFYEAHKTLDILRNEDTSADQLLIGRKLLNHPLRDWGYYSLTLEALYHAHLRYPSNFTEFYNEYARLLDLFISLNSEFGTVIAHLSDYIKAHIRTDKNKIVIFDVGFQGSIALLTKYIIDRHVRPSGSQEHRETDVQLGVGAEWSKKLFGDRAESDYFPFLNRVQLAARSNELYHYKLGSLDSGKIRVVMGDETWQHKAAIELIVLVTVALVEHPTT